MFLFVTASTILAGALLLFGVWRRNQMAQTATSHSPPAVLSPGALDFPSPTQTVRISKCQMGDYNSVAIEATLTNLGSQTATYLVSVNIENAAGVVIGSGANGSPYLAPGQSGYVEMEAMARTRPASFRCVVANVQQKVGTP